MKTKITELFNIEHPIVLSGMSWISTPELVAAVANAGGLGILATGVLQPKETREFIRRTRELTDKPFAANVTLYFPEAEKNAEILIEEKIPILNYSLGKGDKLAQSVHNYGGKVIATVTNTKHALAAQRDGADALIVTGYEAAAHGGEVGSLVLIPTISDLVDIPVIAAGGFADGRGLAAALILGADGIAMGTRLMNTKESPVHEVQKNVCVKKGAFDSLRTNRIDGLPGRFMISAGSKRIMRKKLNPIVVLIKSRKIAKMFGYPWLKMALGILFSGIKNSIQMARMAIGFEAFAKGTIEGDNTKGVIPIGQNAGLISDTPTVKEVINRTVVHAEKFLEKDN